MNCNNSYSLQWLFFLVAQSCTFGGCGYNCLNQSEHMTSGLLFQQQLSKMENEVNFDNIRMPNKIDRQTTANEVDSIQLLNRQEIATESPLNQSIWLPQKSKKTVLVLRVHYAQDKKNYRMSIRDRMPLIIGLHNQIRLGAKQQQ